MNKNFHKIFTGLSFFIPLIIYIITMAPTTSFWDCGEYIASSRILGVPHPPGSPLYLLLGNVFSSIPIFSDIGARVNLISPIASAFSVMFLYLIIVYLIEEYRGKTKNISDVLITYCPAFIAALTFAVTDSHWFNAVESEVYSLSTFFTAIVAWLILKWSRDADNWNLRYLLIIVYMFGLAIGVHLLNLLTLPFVALIIYFKKYNFKISTFLITTFTTLLTFLIIYVGIIKGLPDITNKMGNLLFAILLPIIIILNIILNNIIEIDKKYIQLCSAISLITITLLLFNSLFINTPEQIINNKYDELILMGEKLDTIKKDIDNLQNNENYDYVIIESKIKQYNEIGKSYKVELDSWEQLQKMEDLSELNYWGLISLQSPLIFLLAFLIFSSIILIYFYFSSISFYTTQSFINFFLTCIILVFIGYSTYMMIFIRANQHPNINENSPDTINRALAYMNRDQYGDWSILDRSETIKRPENTNWKRYTYDKTNPPIVDQISFFINYQVNEMYLRYFSWQFIGRGERENYPWHIKDLDGNSINNQKPLDGINWFRYGIPLAFILGIIGVFFHFLKDWKRALAVLSFFLATGLMIIIYLNQYDPQPRERDYSFIASFFAFSIWIGIGLSGVLSKIKSFFEDYNIASFISISCLSFTFIFMPIKIFSKDYLQHNRSGNYVAWDYGYNLLNSCEPAGIIFTNGDNDTFPLWYLQEVEGIRKDVKVINLSLLNTPWYIKQLINKYPQLDLNISDSYLSEKINYKGEIIKSHISDIYNLTYITGTKMVEELCHFSSQKRENLNCILQTNAGDLIFKYKPSQGIGQWLPLQDTMILQIISDVGNDKPIYFATTVSTRNQIGLEKYLQMEGMVYRLLFNPKTQDINYKKMKQNLTKSNSNKIINKNDYKKAIESGVGIYRYTNLNDTSIYYNNNIKRLVQNYRYGFINLAQDKVYKTAVNDELEIISVLDSMNKYFPKENLPLEASQNLLLAETIYKPIGDNTNYNKIIYELANNELFNNNIAIELKIEIIRILSIIDGLSPLFIKSINNFFEIYSLTIEHEMYLATFLYQSLSLDDFNYLYDNVFNKHLSLETEVILLQTVSETDNANLIEQTTLRIFNKFFDINKQFNFELQKYIGDNISKYLTIGEFKNICENIFVNYYSTGMLYSLTFSLEENKISTKKILEITNKWLKVNPEDEELTRLKTYLIQSNQFQ